MTLHPLTLPAWLAVLFPPKPPAPRTAELAKERLRWCRWDREEARAADVHVKALLQFPQPDRDRRFFSLLDSIVYLDVFVSEPRGTRGIASRVVEKLGSASGHWSPAGRVPIPGEPNRYRKRYRYYPRASPPALSLRPRAPLPDVVWRPPSSSPYSDPGRAFEVVFGRPPVRP